MKRCTMISLRGGIAMSLAATALTGMAVAQAGPGCMNDQRYMSRGHYPYSPAGQQPVYGRPVPYGYYSAPAPVQRYMTPHNSRPMTAQPGNQGYLTRPATSAPVATSPAQPTLATASKPDDAAGEAVTVRIYGMRFEPPVLNVKPGTTVTWIQDSRMPHTVTGKTGKLRSDTLNPGQQFSHTFDTEGSYKYACDFHPSMQGSVVVKDSGRET